MLATSFRKFSSPSVLALTRQKLAPVRKKLIKENKKLTELATTEELSQTEEPIEETNPEGMELDEDYGDSFFRFIYSNATFSGICFEVKWSK